MQQPDLNADGQVGAHPSVHVSVVCVALRLSYRANVWDAVLCAMHSSRAAPPPPTQVMAPEFVASQLDWAALQESNRCARGRPLRGAWAARAPRGAAGAAARARAPRARSGPALEPAAPRALTCPPSCQPDPGTCGSSARAARWQASSLPPPCPCPHPPSGPRRLQGPVAGVRAPRVCGPGRRLGRAAVGGGPDRQPARQAARRRGGLRGGGRPGGRRLRRWALGGLGDVRCQLCG